MLRAKNVLLVVCLFVCLAPRVSAATVYSGAAGLFGLERVTVVHAASPGSDVPTNRLCAERRAAYLRHKHRVDATVVADSAVTPDQLRGDLLVIGWDNRLLGTEAAPSPISEAESGRLFLGDIPVRKGEDLLFATASPYNPERRLVFWSRTDVEVDRYFPMPFTGSDWAVFRDYTIARQGNFLVREGWPPSRNIYAEQDHSVTRGGLSAVRKSARYTLHYAPGTLPDPEVDRVLAAREAALAKAIGLLANPGPDFHIQLFVYRDRAAKRAETDVNDVVHSNPASRELHVTAEYAATGSPHEEIHLVARALWGPTYHTALYEGLAIALERPEDVDRFAAVTVERGGPAAPGMLLDEEALRGMSAEAAAFPSAALLVRWMIDAGGLDLVGRLYGAKPLTVPALASAIGGAERDPGAEFAAWVRKRADGVPATFRYPMLLAEVDRLIAAGDPAGARGAAGRALALRPGDPTGRLKLGQAVAAAGDKATAEETFRDLLTLPAEGETLTVVVHAHYQLGHLLEDTGRSEEARTHYEAMLALPDARGSHQAARDELGPGPASGSGSGP